MFACLEAEDFGDELERQCGAHPEAAPQLRRIAERLHAEGLVGDSGLTLSSVFASGAPGPVPGEAIPEQLGDFTLLRRLGVGGMGVVHLAEDRRLGRRVAIKLVRPEQLWFPGSRERFRREIEAIARLQHPGIVAIHGIGEEHGLPFFSMEYVRGASLARVIARLRGRDPARLRAEDLYAQLGTEEDPLEDRIRPAGPSRTSDDPADNWVLTSLRIVRDVADALVHAHEQGVLHRDVKPSNILLDRSGRPRLVDFGLARLEDAPQELTRSAAELGSLPYMAPEVLSGRVRDATAAVDVYGLGVTLYELLTLHAPFSDADLVRTRQRILHGDCPPLRELNPAVHEEVQTVCRAAMEPARARRYSDMGALLADLDALLARRPIRARPAGIGRRTARWIERHPATAVGLGMFVALLCVTLLFALQQRALAQQERDTSYRLGILAAGAQLEQGRAGDAKASLALCPPELRGFEWEHLELRCNASEAVWVAGVPLLSLAIHPEGVAFVAGTSDGRVLQWRWAAADAPPETILQLPHAGPGTGPRIEGLAFGPGARHLFVAASDHRLHRIDLVSGRHDALAEHASPVTSLAADPSGRWLATGSSKGEVWLHDAEGRLLADLRGADAAERAHASAPERPIEGLAFTADGSRLFAGELQQLLVFDPESRAALAPLVHEDENWIFCVLPEADGRHVVTCGTRGLLQRWDLETRSQVRFGAQSVLFGIEAGVRDPHRGTLFVAGTAGPIVVCSAEDFAPRARLLGHEASVTAMALSPDGESFLSASRDGTVRRWSTTANSPMRVLGRHEGLVGCLALRADGRTLLSGSSDGNVRSWDVETGAMQELFSSVDDKVHDLALAPEGTLVFSSGGLHTLQPDPGAAPRLVPGTDASYRLLVWNADGAGLVAVLPGGRLVRLDPGSGTPLASSEALMGEGRDRYVQVLAVCPWNGEIVTGSSSGRVACFDGQSLAHARDVIRLDAAVGSIAFDTSRRALVIGDFAGAIRVVDCASGRALQEPVVWKGEIVRSLELSPDGRRLVSGAMSRALQVWDYPQLRQLLPLTGHTRAVFALRFAPDGQRLFSSSWDGTIRVWETRRR